MWSKPAYNNHNKVLFFKEKKKFSVEKDMWKYIC